MSFRYATGQVWLLDLAPAPHPSLYDLCAAHADSLTVPRGWERVDERSPAPGSRVGAAGARRLSPAPMAEDAAAATADRDRYERLRAQLPEVAARLARERRPAPATGAPWTPATGRRDASRRRSA